MARHLTLCVAAFAALSLSGCDKLKEQFDPNKEAVYGQSGLPKNCRALIAEATEGWRSGKYTPIAALDSIERNCGRYGYTWDEGR